MRTGLILTVASAFVLSVTSVGIKSTESSIGQLVFLKSVIVLITSYCLVRRRGATIITQNDNPLNWIQYTGISAVEFLNALAVRMMPLADEAVIAYTSIAFTIILARIFLRETCDWKKMSATLVIFSGLLLTTKRSVGGYPDYILGCGITLLGAFLDAVNGVTMKRFTQHYTVYLFKLSCVGLLVFSPTYWFEKWEWTTQVLLISVVEAVHEFLYLIALSTEQLGIVTLVHSSDIAFCYLLELIVYDEAYTAARLLGTALILGAAILTMFLEKDDEKDDDDDDGGGGGVERDRRIHVV